MIWTKAEATAFRWNVENISYSDVKREKEEQNSSFENPFCRNLFIYFFFFR